MFIKTSLCLLSLTSIMIAYDTTTPVCSITPSYTMKKGESIVSIFHTAPEKDGPVVTPPPSVNPFIVQKNEFITMQVPVPGGTSQIVSSNPVLGKPSTIISNILNHLNNGSAITIQYIVNAAPNVAVNFGGAFQYAVKVIASDSSTPIYDTTSSPLVLTSTLALKPGNVVPQGCKSGGNASATCYFPASSVNTGSYFGQQDSTIIPAVPWKIPFLFEIQKKNKQLITYGLHLCFNGQIVPGPNGQSFAYTASFTIYPAKKSMPKHKKAHEKSVLNVVKIIKKHGQDADSIVKALQSNLPEYTASDWKKFICPALTQSGVATTVGQAVATGFKLSTGSYPCAAAK